MSIVSASLHLHEEKLDVQLDTTSLGTLYLNITEGYNGITIFGTREQLKQIADAINNYVEAQA